MYENSFYATVPIDTDAYLNRGQYHEDAFYLLPEEVQEQVLELPAALRGIVLQLDEQHVFYQENPSLMV